MNTKPVDPASSTTGRPLTIKQALEQALQHHSAGRLPEAERLYRQILQSDPNQPVALHLLGVIATHVGKADAAVDLITKALVISPDYAEAHYNLGNALKNLGKLDEAVASYQKACATNPKFAEAHNNLGNTLKDLGKLDEAVSSYHRVLAIAPDNAEVHYNLGIALQAQGKLDEAVASYHKALAIAPDNAEAHNNLGNALKDIGKLDEAAASLHKALVIAPEYADAHNSLGAVLQDLGKLDDAVASYHKALAIKSDYHEAHCNLGLVLQDQGKLDDAVASYHNAIAIKFDYAEAHYSLGNAFKELAKLDEAMASYYKALAIRPDYVEAHYNLGNAFKNLGKLDEAVSSYRKALAIAPDFAEAHNNLGNALKELGKIDEAVSSFDMAGTRLARSMSLECNYALERYDVFHTNLATLIETDKSNIRAAAISAFAAQQLGCNDPYPFCKNPLDFVRVSHLDACAADTEGLIDEILDEISHRSAVWEPIGLATRYGFQTPPDLFSNPENGLAKLDRVIKEEIDAYYSEFGSMHCTFIDLWPKVLRIHGWYVRLLDKGHQTAHIHDGGWLSGVFYLKVPKALQKDEGAIEFSLYGHKYPILNDDYPRMLHHPKVGEIVLFPSSLFHKTVPISGDSERLSIAFDLFPR